MMKILIVDDEPIVQKVLSEALRAEGFETISALDGEKGLSIAFSQKPDLILLDIIMPKMDGISVLKKLKESPRTKEIPIVVLTNLREGEAIDISEKSGVLGYLVKADYTLKDLVAKIRNFL